MRFGAPAYLWLLLLLPLLAALMALLAWRRRRDLERFGDLDLMRRLSASVSPEKRVAKAVLLVVAAAFLILALARPQWGARTETVTRRGIDVIVAVDTSLSMLAEDVKPNRLAQAQGAVRSLLDLLQGDRIGLVAFAGTSYVACPLTLDYGAAAMFVDVLDTDLLPVPGTAIAQAIRSATDAFGESEQRHKVLILITDGEDHEGDLKAAVAAAADKGIVIYALGVGSPAGTPIPLRNERGEVSGYKEDREKRKVTSRLDEGALEEMAAATHGKYYRSTPEGIELRKVWEEIAGMDRKEISARMETTYEERYTIPLAAAFLLLAVETALGDRRRPPHGDRERPRDREAA
jgi:Ca-activated chloride channel family protein